MPLASAASELVLEHGSDVKLALPDPNALEGRLQRLTAKPRSLTYRMHFTGVLAHPQALDELRNRPKPQTGVDRRKTLRVGHRGCVCLEADHFETRVFCKHLPKPTPDIGGDDLDARQFTHLRLYLCTISEIGEDKRFLPEDDREPGRSGEAREVPYVGKVRDDQTVETLGRQEIEQRLPASGAPIM